jgi:hypothetical protein
MIDVIAFVWIEAVAILFTWTGLSSYQDETKDAQLAIIQIVVGLMTMWSGAVL